MRIAISYAPIDDPSYAPYHAALHAAAERTGVELTVLDAFDEPERLAQADGLVLTGGEDVHSASAAYRDPKEFGLAERALAKRLPILAICRGMQLLNVHLGGTLIQDLGERNARHRKDLGDGDKHHQLALAENSDLALLLCASHGEINSSHHQAVNRIAPPLRIIGHAPEDLTTEAFAWIDPEGKSPLIAVQWHPERMDAHSPFGGGLIERFLRLAGERVPA